MNFLFFIVFLLFSVLIVKLGMVQIVYGDEFLREVKRTENALISTTVPRGKMYDRNFNPIVDNKPLNAITYTKYPNAKTEDMLETAEKLAQLITQNTKKITERDQKDFWIIKNPKKAKALISDERTISFKR